MRRVVGNFASKEAADKALDALGDMVDRNAVETSIADGVTTVTAQVDDGHADAVHAVFQKAGSTVDEVEHEESDDPDQEAVDRFRDPASIVAPVPR